MEPSDLVVLIPVAEDNTVRLTLVNVLVDFELSNCQTALAKANNNHASVVTVQLSSFMFNSDAQLTGLTHFPYQIFKIQYSL